MNRNMSGGMGRNNYRPGNGSYNDLNDRNYGNNRRQYNLVTDEYGGQSNYDGSSGTRKTAEQIAFDTEFEKWQQSFDEWKRMNANNSDPAQYRYYENRFLDVRTKLMEKRKEIYAQNSNNNDNFDKQLNMADAMANSILSKFGSSSRQEVAIPRMAEPSYGSLSGMGLTGLLNMGSGIGDLIGGQIASELRFLNSNPENRWLLTALTRALAGQRVSPERSYDRRRDRSRDKRFGRDDRSFKSRDRRFGRGRSPNRGERFQKGRGSDVRMQKKDDKNKSNQEIKIEQFYEKIDDFIKTANEVECPKLLTGRLNKYVRDLKQKNYDELQEKEKKLWNLFDLISAKRSVYFEKIDREREEAKKLKEQEQTKEAQQEGSQNIAKEGIEMDVEESTKLKVQEQTVEDLQKKTEEDEVMADPES